MSLFKTIKNSLYFGVIPKITTLINIVILPIITPYLTPYDYGVWGIITSYSSFIVALVPLGLNMHLSNSFFEYKKWQLVWGRILFLFFITGCIGAITLTAILFMELSDFSYGMRLLIGVCSSIPVLLFGNGVLASHLYPLLEKPKPLVFRNLAGSLCSMVVSFIAIYVFHLGFWGFILGALVASIVTFFLFVPALYIKEGIRPTIDRNVKRVKDWIKIASPVIPHTLGFMLLSSSSRIIMSLYNIPVADIGVYSNGYMMGDYITIVATSLATALSPQIQRAYRSEDYTRYRHMYYLCQTIVISLVFCMSFWMSDIYRLLIRNAAFAPAVSVASFICYANVLMPLYVFVSSICFIDKKTPQLLWMVFLPGFINVLLCVVFIPLYGYEVAKYSALIAFWSQLLVPFISKYHRQKIGLWLGNRIKLVALFVIIVSCLIASNLLININLYGKVTLTIIVLGTAFGFIKYRQWDKSIF